MPGDEIGPRSFLSVSEATWLCAIVHKISKNLHLLWQRSVPAQAKKKSGLRKPSAECVEKITIYCNILILPLQV